MKTFKLLTVFAFSFVLALVLMPQISMGQDLIEHGPRFVDEDGDGYNDNAPDHDGDGIPNGLDSDYTPLNDGTDTRAGRLSENRLGYGVHGRGFIDENGDGFNDNAPDIDNDGIPNGVDPDYTPFNNGTGNGDGTRHGRRTRTGDIGGGDCDGTGIGVKSSVRTLRSVK